MERQSVLIVYNARVIMYIAKVYCLFLVQANKAVMELLLLLTTTTDNISIYTEYTLTRIHTGYTGYYVGTIV